MRATAKETTISRNREAESRRLQEREEELRDVVNTSYADPLYVDPALVPEGWEYHWGRESYMGHPDDGRIVELRKKGWTPVPASRHPSMVFEHFWGNKEYLRGFISHKGLVLVERPKSIGDKARAMLNALNNRIKHSMPGTEHFQSQPGIATKSLYKDADSSYGLGTEQGW